MASVIGEVRGVALLRTRSMPIFEMTVGQNLTALKAMWFHGTYLKDRFKTGQMVALYGKVEPSRSSRNFKMIQPQFELLPMIMMTNRAVCWKSAASPLSTNPLAAAALPRAGFGAPSTICSRN